MKGKIKKEIERCKELLVMYEQIPTGFIGASMIRMSIKNTESILQDRNWIESKAKEILKDLKEIEG
jgi:hypothetical protein